MNPIGALKANLAEAQDEQITRVVALVDAMPQRGAADDLIAPLRPRLQQLRPKRTVGLFRLLFTPIDPLIVPAQRWQRGSVLVPRTALAPLGAALRAAIAGAAALEVEAAAIDTTDHAGIARIGRRAWPLAAAACDAGLPAGDWQAATGLAERDRAGLVSLIGAVLHAAVAIEDLTPQPIGEAHALREVLTGAVRRGPAAFGAIFAALLARPPLLEGVVACAAEIGSGECRHAMDAAVETMLDRTGVAITGIQSASSAALADIPRLAALLDGLEQGSAGKPDRRKRIQSIRRDAGEACRRAFQSVATQGILGRTAGVTGEVSDAEVAGLEASARDLRRIEAGGRRFGGSGEAYAAVLKTCRNAFGAGARSPLELADRVRMLELLGAPDEALALLKAG